MDEKRLAARVVSWVLFLVICLGGVLAVSPKVAAEPHEFVSQVGELPNTVFAPAVEEADGRLYVIGGLLSDPTGSAPSLDTVWVYDIQSGETSPGRSLPNGTALAVSCKGVDGRIYVFGGWNVSIGGYTYFTQIYDPGTDSWSNGSSSPEPVGGGDAVALPDGRILLVGAAVQHLNSTLMYDPLTDRWSYAADQPSSTWLRRAVLWNSTATIAMGGRSYHTTTETDDVSVFNPVTGVWSSRARMISAAHSGGAAVGANGYVYYVGGSTGSWPSTGTLSSEIQRYDPVTDTWELSYSRLPKALGGFGCAVDAYGRIFVVGGYDGSSTVSSVCMIVPADIDWDAMAITSPSDGSVVSGVAAVTVETRNLWYGFSLVELCVDGVLLDQSYAGWTDRISFNWDVRGLPDGSVHVLTARGYVSSGEIVEDSVSVTVWALSPDERIVALQENLTALQQGLLLMLAGQAAAMEDLNATLDDLQRQLDEFDEQIDRVEGKADDANMWGMVNLGLVVVVLILGVVLVLMSVRKR
ncbi:MAG: hypothetical protein QXQ13_03355 [Thermoplasmata archaeon]